MCCLLEWCIPLETYRAHMAHIIVTTRQNPLQLSDRIVRLTDDQAAMLRKRAAGGEKKAALAPELGISRKTLYQYLRA
jgi:hypothetical protein